MYFQAVETLSAFNTRGRGVELMCSTCTSFRLTEVRRNRPQACFSARVVRGRVEASEQVAVDVAPRCKGASSETRVQVESTALIHPFQKSKFETGVVLSSWGRACTAPTTARRLSPRSAIADTPLRRRGRCGCRFRGVGMGTG